MNIVLVLSGGTGARMGTNIPKQYHILAAKPVIVHTLEQFQQCLAVDAVFAVASTEWKSQILQWKSEFSLKKLLDVVPGGPNRQLSIRNGVIAAEPYVDSNEVSGVIIQDAVRPLTSVELLNRLIAGLQEAPCVMPVLPVTDTTYTSRDGQWVDGLLDRPALYGGQAPEAFHYRQYMQLYRDTPEEILCAMSGSCQLPYSQGWKVKMIPGEKKNIKITYPLDLKMCEILLKEREK